MGWEDRLLGLFDDLEQQAEGLHLADRDAEVADRSRAEYARVTLADRLHASTGQQLTLDIRGVGRLAGVVRRVGSGWLLLRDEGGREWLVRFDALARAGGAPDRAVHEQARSLGARLGFGSALRGLAESGDPALVRHVDGAQSRGRVARVGEDFVELLREEDRSYGVAAASPSVELVSLSSIAAVCLL